MKRRYYNDPISGKRRLLYCNCNSSFFEAGTFKYNGCLNWKPGEYTYRSNVKRPCSECKMHPWYYPAGRRKR